MINSILFQKIFTNCVNVSAGADIMKLICSNFAEKQRGCQILTASVAASTIYSLTVTISTIQVRQTHCPKRHDCLPDKESVWHRHPLY